MITFFAKIGVIAFILFGSLLIGFTIITLLGENTLSEEESYAATFAIAWLVVSVIAIGIICYHVDKSLSDLSTKVVNDQRSLT